MRQPIKYSFDGDDDEDIETGNKYINMSEFMGIKLWVYLWEKTIPFEWNINTNISQIQCLSIFIQGIITLL